MEMMSRAQTLRRDGLKLRHDRASLALAIARRRAELRERETELAKKDYELAAWQYAREKMMQDAEAKGYKITVRRGIK